MKTANAKMHLKKLNNKPKQSGSEPKLLTVTIYVCLSTRGLTSSSNGVDCWARNEEMVDWIAIQYSKIKKVFQQLGCDE